MGKDSISEGDAWFQDLSEFARPICEKLRRMIRKVAPDLEEVTRWHLVCYKGEGLVCGIGAYKARVDLMFFRGAELEDKEGVFLEGLGGAKSREIRYTSAAQIRAASVQALIKAAVVVDGTPPPKVPAKKRAEIPMPEALKKALTKNKIARANYEAMAPSHRREYNEWIAGAKQEATVLRRVEAALVKLAAGEGLHDKYRKK